MQMITTQKMTNLQGFKIDPVVQTLRVNCLNVEQEQFQKVPAKTKRGEICQYTPKKIHFVRGLKRKC